MFGGKKKKKGPAEVNASSMADIAFLLLIFFLVTTTIASEKGLTILLPPKKEDQEDIEIKVKERNLFKVIVNSRDRLLVENDPLSVGRLKEKAKEFINNNGRDKNSSDSPQKAIVALKTDRGTSYKRYIDILDQLKAAYHELRAEHMGITIEEYLTYSETEAVKDPCLRRKVAYFGNNLGIEDMTPQKYLNFNPEKSRDMKKIQVYQKARKLCPMTFAEKYYDAKRAFPLQISEAEPTSIGG